MKMSKKELKELEKLSIKIMNEMDGYNVYICIKAMTAIIAHLIMTHHREIPNKDKCEMVIKMIKDNVLAQALVESFMNQSSEKVH